MSQSELQTFREALAAVGRDPIRRASFGIERQMLAGALWRERLVVEGSGRVGLETLRSFGDASGEEIGRYDAALSPERVSRVLKALEPCLPEAPRVHLEPSDLRVVLSAVADGARFLRVAGGGPPQMEPYLDLMSELDKAGREVREHPRATLAMEFRLVAPPRKGTQEARVEVTFRNRGAEGFWVRNPLFEMAEEDDEHVRLWYARESVAERGVTALPVEPVGEAMYAVVASDRPLLWIEPRESRLLEFVTRMDLDPGRYLLRAAFSSYEGEDEIGGRTRLRGCVFSPELSVEVED